jgi:hypothetical protein
VPCYCCETSSLGVILQRRAERLVDCCEEASPDAGGFRATSVQGTASIARAEAAIELPIFLQNALISCSSESPGTLCEWCTNETTNLWNLAAQFFLGSIALALVTLALFRLGIDLASIAFAYLIVIVVLSLVGSSICPSIAEAHGGRLSAHHLKRDEQGE